jgi:hypothetical protein
MAYGIDGKPTGKAGERCLALHPQVLLSSSHLKPSNPFRLTRNNADIARPEVQQACRTKSEGYMSRISVDQPKSRAPNPTPV